VEKQADQEYLAVYFTGSLVWFDVEEDRALCMAGLYRSGHTTESENSL
jgi:hypothetical protein